MTKMASIKSSIRGAVCVLACLAAARLAAFDPSIHEDATEEVLRALGFDSDSADEVGDSNYWTDTFEASSDAAHADNNQLGAASSRLREKRTLIGDSLNACQRRDALDALGEALHTVQDVYSHSNSIDNNHPIPNLLSMVDGSAPCALPDFAPGGLVTGYFSLSGFLMLDQCRGIGSNECCHRDLNKDNPDKPNGARHGDALSAARGATEIYVNLVEDDIESRFSAADATQYLKMLKRKQRTTVFVIDDTGSMADDIAGVQASANTFLDSLIAGNDAPTLGLVTFKDEVDNRGLTCSIEDLRNQINALFASGGNDCPEASNEALLAALAQFPIVPSDIQARGGRILLATDASDRNPSLGPSVAARAAVRGASVDVILTGDCFEEEDALPRQAARLASNDATHANGVMPLVAKASDPLTSQSARTQLRALTDTTGGVLFNVERLEVDDVVPTLLELGDPDSALVMSRRIELQAGIPLDLEVMVDDEMIDRVTFMITTSRNDELPTIRVMRPNGQEVGAGDGDTVFRELSSVLTIAVGNPATGKWRARLEGEGSFVFRAFGGTPFRLNGLRLQKLADVPMRPEVELVPIDGQPVAGSTIFGDLRFTDEPRDLRVFLRRPDGTLLEELSPSPLDSGRRFRVELTVPGEAFVIEAAGRTPGGNFFTRQIQVPVIPQLVGLTALPEIAEAAPGSTARFQLTVFNGSTDEARYHLSASGTFSWPISTPPDFTIASGASSSLLLEVTVPDDAALGARNDLIILVEDLDRPGVRNSAAVTVVTAAVDDGCVPSSINLCLSDQRFRVDVDWRDMEGNAGAGQVVPLGSADSGLFFFADSDKWEMLVKVLDACEENDHFWVFAAAATEVEYTLRVTDTITGSMTTYFNPLGNVSPAFTDTMALATCSPSAARVDRIVRLDSPELRGEDLLVHHQLALASKAEGGCMSSSNRLCLQEGRFAVEVTWRDLHDHVGTGQVVPGGSNTSGLLWFFRPDNWEMLIRVVDGCANNDRFWVFAAASTNMEYTLRVTDTESGEVREYFNPILTSAKPVLDTAAFATCP